MLTATKRLDPTISTNNEVGYHQNWSPMGLASEIDNNKVVGVDFLGSRVVMYRDSAGKAVVHTAYCRHLGADLSVGEVVDGQLRCLYHHWQYNSQGHCVKIPSGDKIPPGAQLFSYPTVEAFGLVWAFNGPEPLYGPPGFPGLTEDDLVYEAMEFDTLPCEPWLAISNSMDFQHLRALHHLTLGEPSNLAITPYGLDYDIEMEGPGIIGTAQQHIRVVGTNTFMLMNKMAGFELLSMSTFRQLPSGQSVNYLVSAVRKPPVDNEQTRQMIRQAFDGNVAFAKQLTDDDRKVLTTIHFREGLLVESDRHLAHFFKYVRTFPRSDPASEYK